MNSQNSETLQSRAQVSGLVLSCMDYREQDGILRLATDEGVVSVLARGIQKESSKNKRLTTPYSKVILQYDPRYSGDMLYLITGQVVESWWRISENLEQQSLCIVLSDLLCKIHTDGALNEALEMVWKSFHTHNDQKALAAACWMIARLLRDEGFGLFVDGCVVCQETKIWALDMVQGGFVCRKHANDQEPWSRQDLMKYRALNKAPVEQLQWLSETFSWSMDDVLYLLDWYSWHGQGLPRSIRFLRTVMEMKSKAS